MCQERGTRLAMTSPTTLWHTYRRCINQEDASSSSSEADRGQFGKLEFMALFLSRPAVSGSKSHHGKGGTVGASHYYRVVERVSGARTTEQDMEGDRVESGIPKRKKSRSNGQRAAESPPDRWQKRGLAAGRTRKWKVEKNFSLSSVISSFREFEA